jgi:U32 family peptidase
MKILAPVDSLGEINILKKAGATEFYCGYIPPEWVEKYNKKSMFSNKYDEIQISLNKKDTLYSNVENIDILNQMVVEAEECNAQLFLTLNAFCFPSEAYNELEIYLDAIHAAGIHGLIMTDVGLIAHVRNRFPNMKIILSTCNQSLNKWSNQFFKEIGVNRITFPRHVSIDEIIELTKDEENLEFECFALDGRCIYDDGNCKIFHSIGFFCRDQWDYEYFKSDNASFNYSEMEKLYKNEEFYTRWSKPYPSINCCINGWRNVSCSICSIPSLISKSRITTLKIAGRGCSKGEKIAMVRYISKAIKMAESGKGYEDLKNYAKKVLLIPEICDNRTRCYMPSLKYTKEITL